MDTALKFILPGIVVFIIVAAFVRYFGGDGFFTSISTYFTGLMEKATTLYMSTP